jgi:phytanoyl-CoA hydroxylase
MSERLVSSYQSSFYIQAPDGSKISIPMQVEEPSDHYALLQTSAEIRDYYHQNGYVVLRNLLSTELCDRARQAFNQDIKPYSGYLYRQPSSGAAEKHILDKHGYMLNSILNIQNLNKRKFPHFKDTGLAVITHPSMYQAVQTILGEPGTIVQSMYFEGNPATWAHQDTYYLDSTRIGEMTAAWIALEDIQPGAGRFYIYPGSHKIDMMKNGGDFDIAFNHVKYKELVLKVIRDYQLECRAPALRKGDVLFWAAKTIHGSLETTQPQFSRSSMTTHFIPSSAGFLQFQVRERRLSLRQVGPFQVDCSKDQSQLKHQLILDLESRFPQTFQQMKRFAIKLVTK